MFVHFGTGQDVANEIIGFSSTEIPILADRVIEVFFVALQKCCECRIKGVPAGLGDPCFEKLSANLGKAILSIGAVKGFEIGDGFAVAESTGLTNNDAFYYNNEGMIEKKTNHAGGILGGISDGSEIIFLVAVKPTPSIFAEQETVNKNGENISVNVKGRHDPCVVLRAMPVVEAVTAIALYDAWLLDCRN